MTLSSRVAIVALLLAVALGRVGTASAAGDPVRGKLLSYTCLGCHGVAHYKNAYPMYDVPRLAGQHADYIVAALKEYASGERSHATMHEQAASLSDQDMQDIAAYFSQPALSPAAAAVGAAPAKVTQVCAGCHSLDGVGIAGNFPNLAGQYADYIAQALKEYQHGDRKNPIMPTFAAGLSAQDIADIADYYAQQRPALNTLARRDTILSQ